MSMTVIWIGYQSVRDHVHRVLEISASPGPPELGAHGNRFKQKTPDCDNRRIATEETSNTRMIQIIAFLLPLTV